MLPNVLLINGSPIGRSGNTARLLAEAERSLAERCEVDSLILSDEPYGPGVERKLNDAHGFVFGTGTYWDSWGSPLQRFLEEATHLEATSTWLGKPAAIITSNHAIGGEGVLTRLQGVLSSLGLLIPPMSGVVCSYANQLAIASDTAGATDDMWRPDDIQIAVSNLEKAMALNVSWDAWPVERASFRTTWVKTGG